MKSKINIILVIVTLFTVNSLYAQTSKLKKNDFAKLISKKWIMIEAQMDGQTIPASMLGDNRMTFNLDGTYTVSEQGEKYSGKWNYDENKKQLLTNDRDGKEAHNIIRLTNDELITEIRDQNSKFIFTYSIAK